MQLMKYLVIVALCFTTPALAQQQATPAEVALQINSVVSQWATTLTQQGRVIEDLQKQITAKDAKIKELEAKTEPKKE